ncbi:uncharacterized protein C22orf15 homolog [Carlito syrichta]|uniref:Uncharacterized protein C22orf15 homolog n=1 Tax=Carlito syrichta TaxID=1868482 RepID=A0A3Q0EC10_CARSF|nr:uncharacterized protein C22orf15 homolog [Carlito syrichta]
MFIKVMFGAGCWELVNTWCSLVTLAAHLRQRGNVPPDAALALLAEDGRLVSLDEDPEEGASRSTSMGSSLLDERETYVLVQIISEWGPGLSPVAMVRWGEGGAPTRYESLLENLDDECPELAGANRQQPSRIPLAEPGISEKLHQQEGKGHRWDIRQLGYRKRDPVAETRRVDGAVIPESSRAGSFWNSSPQSHMPLQPPANAWPLHLDCSRYLSSAMCSADYNRAPPPT